MARVDKEYFQSVVQELREGLEEIGKITALSLDEFMRSRSLRFAMRYSVVLVVESAADLGVAILKQCFGEGAGSYREVFLKLAERGVISFRTAEGMASLASLSNMVVHRYWSIDDAKIYTAAKSGGADVVEMFIREVSEFVAKDP